MKKVLLLFTLSVILLACGGGFGDKYTKTDFSSVLSQAPYVIDVTDMGYSVFADTIYMKFKIIDKKNNEKDFWGEIRPQENEIKILNDKIEIHELRSLTSGNAKGNIPDNILVSLLIDKNISESDMINVQEAVRYLVDNCPDNTVFVSFFDNEVGISMPINSETFDQIEGEFQVSGNKKIIFDAALIKFRELAGEKDLSFHPEIIEKANDGLIRKYMILLTDGQVDVSEPNTAGNIYAFNEFVQQIDMFAEDSKQIEIHAIRYGEPSTDVDASLSFICRNIRNENVKGGFYTADPDSILIRMKEFTDKLSPDYELVLVNTPGRIYSGEHRNFVQQVVKDSKIASGIKNYVIGTPANPIVTGSFNGTQQTIFGFIWGIIILFISFFIIQVVVPYLIYKTSNFEKKYIQRYKSNDDELVKCNFCSEELLDDEEIVVRCQHLMHKHCWRENGNKCTEYGQSCKDGKQYYFDKTKPFSSVNSPFLMKWVLYGMVGGFVSWLIYQYFVFRNPLIFESFTYGLLRIFYPSNLQQTDTDIVISFMAKIGPLLLIGPLLGFILTFLFSYINEYRRRNMQVMLEILWRSFFGAFSGFITFLIGSIIILVCKSNGTNIWTDWIPWLLFGGCLGVCLSIKTTIVWKHALFGGILSGLISFILLFFSKWFGSYAVLFSFMLYSAGLGASIVTIHRTAQRYFLKYKGDKEGEIAIHKWMSVLGGSNDVTIGRSNHCIVQMNWDGNDTIQDMHARLYIDKKSGIPSLRVLADGLTFNRNVVRKNDEFLLRNGIVFKIGDTEFQYIEKD
jgi:hypothetical protein